MDYEDQFEELRAQVVAKNKGFNDEYFVSSFISGLKDHIKCAVKMFRPQILSDAVFLAKQEEAKGVKPTYQTGAKGVNITANAKAIPQPKEAKLFSPTSSKISMGKEYQTKRSTLSNKEILQRRERGQCFHCDENYHPGQECEIKLYAMLGEEEEVLTNLEVTKVLSEMEQVFEEKAPPAEISLNALCGSQSYNTIRLQGQVKNQKVSILVDSGSTHSFIDSKLVKQLGLVAEMVTALTVIVADGATKQVDTACKNLQYLVQGHKFMTDYIH